MKQYDSNGNVIDDFTLTGSDVGVTLTQIMNAQTINAGVGSGVNFDLSKAKNAQIWVAIDKSFDLTFYPMMDLTANNIPSTGTQTLATAATAPATGRTAVFAITAVPSPAGRLLLTNKDASLVATASIWLVTRNN